MTNVGLKLKTMMKERKLSAPKLAERSGVPLGSIKSIINGVSKSPRAVTLEALARAFDCNITDFLSNGPASLNQEELSDKAKDGLIKECLKIVEEIAENEGISFVDNDERKLTCAKKAYNYAIEKFEEGERPLQPDRVYTMWVVQEVKK